VTGPTEARHPSENRASGETAGLVTVGVVTWNSADGLARCLSTIRQQTHSMIELIVVDNGSTDETGRLLEQTTTADERLLLPRNTGFSAAHNLAIGRSRGEFYLALNPDVCLSTRFVERLVGALQGDHSAGSACGKLLRADGSGRLDSTGIFMLPTQRHLDRGADEVDCGQYDVCEYVFGASGAAALYRRRMLEDVKVLGEYFDEDFFAYREDADLAWRAQLYGWRCLYVPDAIAEHVRHVTPERRSRLAAAINRSGVRNRFLLRFKNQPLASAVRFAIPTLWRDLQVLGYVVVREQSSLPAIAEAARLLPRMMAKRRVIMRKRRIRSSALNAWFKRRAMPVEHCDRWKTK
jgi:GT2 family glycosyltransferase